MRKTERVAMFILLFGFLFGSGAIAQQSGEMIFYNGKIVTVDDHSFTPKLGTIAQAMHIKDGKILHLGTNAQIRAMAGPNTKTIDLKGRTVIPGFVLTHEHPWDWGSVYPQALKKYLSDDQVIVRIMEGSPQEKVKEFPGVLQEAVSKAKPDEWIYIVTTDGKHFEYHTMSNGGLGRALVDPSLAIPLDQMITKKQLDEWAPNNPVYAGGWLTTDPFAGGEGLNQKAIDEAVKAMPDPHMNWFVPVSDESIRSTSPAAAGTRRWMFGDVMLKDHYKELVQIQKSMLEWWAGYGMTAFASNAYAPSNRVVYADLDRRGEMPIRNMWTWNWNPEYLFADPFFVDDLAARLGQGSDYVWFGGAIVTTGSGCTAAKELPDSKSLKARDEQMKAFAQANKQLGNMMAIMMSRCNYAPGSRNAEVISRYIKAGGRFVNLHTSGDQDIDAMMALIAKASREAGMTDEEIRAKRHGMDHGVMWPRPEQIPAMKQLGILASGDSYEIVMASPTVYDMYGEKVASWVVPHKREEEAGINSSFEIDRPIQTTDDVTIFSAGVAPMIIRRAWNGKIYAQDQQVDRATALKIATYRGAYYLMKENVLGSLEPGKWADFLVLDKDYLAVPEEEIGKLHVLMTVVGGKTIHLVPSLAKEIGMQPTGPQVELGGSAAQW